MKDVNLDRIVMDVIRFALATMSRQGLTKYQAYEEGKKVLRAEYLDAYEYGHAVTALAAALKV